jgi:hypothetical protein
VRERTKDVTDESEKEQEENKESNKGVEWFRANMVRERNLSLY